MMVTPTGTAFLLRVWAFSSHMAGLKASKTDTFHPHANDSLIWSHRQQLRTSVGGVTGASCLGVLAECF